MQARLDALESQLKAQRATSARAALAEAQEEVAAAQGATEKNAGMSPRTRSMHRNLLLLNEYKALQQDLDPL